MRSRRTYKNDYPYPLTPNGPDDWPCDRSDYPMMLIMNGWIGPRGMGCPPSSCNIVPVSRGTHVTLRNGSMEAMIVPSPRIRHGQYVSVGLRDRATQQVEQLSRCQRIAIAWRATSTLERSKRASSGSEGKVFPIGSDPSPIPCSIERRPSPVSPHVAPLLRATTRRLMAEDLLKTPGMEVPLAITTKMPRAVPRAAVGVQTVFIGNAENPRLGRVQHSRPTNDFSHRDSAIARRSHRISLNREFVSNIDWNPPQPEYAGYEQSTVDTSGHQIRTVTERLETI